MRRRQYRSRRSIRRRNSCILWLCLLLSFLAVFMVYADRKILPLVVSTHDADITTYANGALHETAVELLSTGAYTYDTLAVISRNSEGTVTSVSANAVTIDLLKSQFMLAAQSKLNGVSVPVRVPLGNFTGSTYLMGRGPNITYKVKVTGNVSADIVSEFTAAGINQTCHSIYLVATGSGVVLLPYRTVPFSYETKLLVAQTVIVGTVPYTYADVDSDGMENLLGNPIQSGGSVN